MSNAYEIQPVTRVTVIGVGNGGVNTVKHMLSRQPLRAEFICADTDARVLPVAAPVARSSLVLPGWGPPTPSEVVRPLNCR